MGQETEALLRTVLYQLKMDDDIEDACELAKNRCFGCGRPIIEYGF
jgi:hypothetical protein